MTIGQRIHQFRIDFGLTQSELAEKINTTKQTIHKYEKGLIANIPLNKIEQLAEVFGINPNELTGWKTWRD